MTAYQQKLARASEIIANHNSGLSDPSVPLDWAVIEAKIKELGGTTDNSLREMTWEDLQDCGIPRLLAREIANQVFRKSDEPVKSKYLSTSRVTMLTLQECFDLYDITGDQNTAVADRLMKESEGKRCVVLEPDGTVNVALSARTLRELKDGFGERDVLTDNFGRALRIVRVGERPNVYFDENPLDPGRPLRGGVCDKSGRSWDNVPTNVRQLLYIALAHTKELAINTVDDIHTVLDRIAEKHGDEAVQYVQRRYPRATLRFAELRETEQLPMLKIKGGKNGSSGKPNDPFYSPHVRT